MPVLIVFAIMFFAAYLLPVLFGDDGINQMPDELRFAAASLADLLVVSVLIALGKLVEVPAQMDRERTGEISDLRARIESVRGEHPMLACVVSSAPGGDAYFLDVTTRVQMQMCRHANA